MVKVKKSKKPPPEGWELIEPTLDELEQKMREAEAEPHEGKRKVEALWPTFKVSCLDGCIEMVEGDRGR